MSSSQAEVTDSGITVVKARHPEFFLDLEEPTSLNSLGTESSRRSGSCPTQPITDHICLTWRGVISSTFSTGLMRTNAPRGTSL